MMPATVLPQSRPLLAPSSSGRAPQQHGAGPSPASTHATVTNRPSTQSGRSSTQSGRSSTVQGNTQSGRREEGQQQGEQGLGGLVQGLLFGAASSLDHRGDTTCLKCRGTGTIDCPTCKGVGILKEGGSGVRKGPAAGLKKALGLQSAKGERSLTTNRCMRCHGFGREPCQVCEGHGFRSPRMKVLTKN